MLVAVPGRLQSFIKSGQINFCSVKYFVLDEADKMLELGFKDSVKRILSHESMTPQVSSVCHMFIFIPY